MTAPRLGRTKNPTPEDTRTSSVNSAHLEPDVVVSGSTVYLFALLTNGARESVNENVTEDRHMLRCSLAVELCFGR